MQIVTDSAADLAPSQLAGLPIHYTTLRLSLGGVPFTGTNEEFYKKLTETGEYPATSQVAAGEFAELYRKVAKKDPEILSIHISGGLSGTINSARVGASMVPEAKITFWDSRTLSAALGWQVEAAGRMIMKGFKLDRILERLTQIRDQVDGMFTIKEMKYLIHGGRVSHLKGLLAQVLNIKPIIGVDHITGMYTNAAQDMTFNGPWPRWSVLIKSAMLIWDLSVLRSSTETTLKVWNSSGKRLQKNSNVLLKKRYP